MKSGLSLPSRDGSALVAVLWLIAILAIATMATLRVVSFDMDVATAKIHGFRAKQLAEMGVALGSNPGVKRTDPMLRKMDEQYGEGYEVKITSEGGRFNINSILLKNDKPLLINLFTSWGIAPEDASATADALGDWIDADDEVSLNGAEKQWYEDQGRMNQPFNHPFYSLDEMRLVRGMDQIEAVKPDWRNWFTVWSGGPLDCNEASAELMAAAAEVPVDTAQQVVDRVKGPDGIRDTDDDAPFQNIAPVLALLGVDTNSRPDIAARLTVNDTTVRIESTGTAEGSKSRTVIILRNRTGRPAILQRTEEVIP